jgi:protoheme IX farnesyltransferase
MTRQSIINFRDYITLTKPGIIRGNALMGAAGLMLGAHSRPNLVTLLGFLLGTSCVIASSCVFNNYLDRNIDKLMSRTKNRALVNGTISTRSALVYAVTLGVTGYVLLALLTNVLTLILGALGMFFYVIVYGIAKRKTVHGTLIGCISGAIPPVAGYAAASNRLDVAALILFLILVFWQMAHFFSIALYRQKDYAATGMPIMPIVRGIETTKRQVIYYISLLSLALIALSITGYTGYVFAIVTVGVCAFWIFKGARTYGTALSAAWGKSMFLTSLLVVVVLSGALMVGAILP